MKTVFRLSQQCIWGSSAKWSRLNG
jgi:hypothetical protein